MSKQIKTQNRHLNCRHMIPYTRGYLTNGSKRPVLASCKHQEHLFPIEENTECKHFERCKTATTTPTR